MFSSAFDFVSKIISSLKPEKERFDRYPALYLLSLLLRVIVLVLAIIAVITVVVIIINIILFRIHVISVGIMFLFYLALASAILLAISEGFLVLVDIERNTRQ